MISKGKTTFLTRFVAVHCRMMQLCTQSVFDYVSGREDELIGEVCCSGVLQCAAVCCSVLQCVALCCSMLQCVAVMYE